MAYRPTAFFKEAPDPNNDLDPNDPKPRPDPENDPAGGTGKHSATSSTDTSQSTGAAFGLGVDEKGSSVDYLAAARAILDAEGEIRLRFNDFSKGIVVTTKRGGQPRGSVSDSLNFVPNKAIGALVQRTGYGAYITIGAGLTDQNAVVKITSISNRFVCGAENPESKVIDVVFGTNGGTSRWMQNPFYNSSATAIASWMQWGESQALTCTAIAGGKTTITFSTTYAIDGYYDGWQIYNSTRDERIYIPKGGFIGSTGVATTNEKVPTDWITGDSYTLYRGFHDNPTFLATPTVGTIPNALPQGNAILASGGQSSNATGKFIWSGYINQTFFLNATNKTGGAIYQGTYLTEAEIKSDNGFTFGNAAAYSCATGNGLDVTKRWFVGYLYETVDGQLSKLQTAGTNYNSAVLTVDQGIQGLITVDFPRMNKRIKKLHVFVGSADFTGAPVTLPWEEYFHVKTLDLTNSSGWTYNESTATPGTYTQTYQVDNTIFQAVDMNTDGTKESVTDWTGTPAYNRSTLSGSFRFHSNRLLVFKSYDYNISSNLPDTISWSGFSPVLGTPQYNVLPDIYGSSQALIEAGDPNAIQHVGGYGSRVLVWKDRSMHEIDTTNPDETQWQVVKIADIGCDLPMTYAETGLSNIGCVWGWTQSGMFYSYNGTIHSLCNNTIQPTFFANLNGITAAQKLTLWGWYSPTNRSYRVMTKQSDLKEFYEAFFELPIDGNPAWFRNKTQHNMSSVGVDRNGTEYFASTNVYSWGTSNLTDAGTAITCSFDTGNYLVSEKNLTKITDRFLAIDQDASATIAGTLDDQLLIDGASITFDSVSTNTSGMTKTSNRFYRWIPPGAVGRTIRYKFNTNNSPGTWTPSSATATQLTIYELSLTAEMKDLQGDATGAN